MKSKCIESNACACADCNCEKSEHNFCELNFKICSKRKLKLFCSQFILWSALSLVWILGLLPVAEKSSIMELQKALALCLNSNLLTLP